MRIKPPRGTQCETCGEPIEVLDPQRFDTARGLGLCIAEPCGHDFEFVMPRF